MNDIQMTSKDFNSLLQETANMNEGMKRKKFTSRMIEILDEERERRFKIIMGIPPGRLISLFKRNAWPW